MAAQDDLAALQELAERMQLDERASDNFINSGMKRLGYQPKMDWTDPENDGSDGDGDFFSTKRDQRDQRRGNGRQQPPNGGGRRASGSDWQYGD